MKLLYYLLISYVILFGFGCGSNQTTEQTLEESEPQFFYNEQYRPQFHFSPVANWMNDPNGMVYYRGEYHLFYQYYPDSTIWGPMHWGHAISKDLVNWEHLPIALYPDDLGYIFSGSAVIDHLNTSSLGTEENPAMVALFTYHHPEKEASGDAYQYQGMAYSLDQGRSWTKYENNPVLENPGISDFRDPKVIWYEPEQKWIMVLAAGDWIQFYSSPDLINWTFESDFGKDYGSHDGVWECPDLIEITVEGSTEKKWVLIVSIGTGGSRGSATQYFTGQFDGTTFVCDSPKEIVKWIDHGWDNYAGVTWANIPDADGRKIFMGWMSNWVYAQQVPTHPWRSSMTLPRELGVFKIYNSYFVSANPIEEVSLLRKKSFEISKQVVNEYADWTHYLDQSKGQLDMEMMTTNIGKGGSWYITLSSPGGDSLLFGFDENQKQFFVDRSRLKLVDFSDNYLMKHTANRLQEGPSVFARIILDEGSIEVFFENGRTVFTELLFPSVPFHRMTFHTTKGAVLVRGNVFHLKSIWPEEGLVAF